MNYKPTTHKEFKKKAFAIPGIKQGYEALEDEFAMISVLMNARRKAGKTQETIAKEMKTTQSVVARIETNVLSRRHAPTLDTLKRYAEALGYVLQIRLVHKKKSA